MNEKEFNELLESVNNIQTSHEKRIAQGYMNTLATLKLQLSEIYENHSVDGVVNKDVWYKFNYLKQLQEQLTLDILTLISDSNEIIEESIVEVYQESYYRNGFSVVQQAMVGFPIFALLTKKVLNSIKFNDNDEIKWNKRNERNNKKMIKKLKNIIREGATKGYSYEKIAKEISNQLDIGKRKAIKISQNETMRAYSQATQQSREDAVAKGIIMKKRWLSTLDSKTRDNHRHLDGQTIEVDDYFISKGGHKALAPKKFGVDEEDINCRCTTISIFEGLEPTVRMAREVDNEYGNIIEYKNFKEWRNSLK